MQLPERFVYTTDDTLTLLDELLADRGGQWWNGFFRDRDKPCPFFVDWPDENLVQWFDEGRLSPGRVLELGTGQGRNATFLAGRGCQVEAIDFSAEAIGWATERAQQAGVEVRFQHSDIFTADIAEGAYDLVYDSGCFHHLAPHRRRSYLELVQRALAPGGRFGLVCFGPEVETPSDQQVYEQRTLGGGLSYSQEQLRVLWDADPFTVEVLRPMVQHGPGGPVFGQDFLWALLAATKG